MRLRGWGVIAGPGGAGKTRLLHLLAEALASSAPPKIIFAAPTNRAVSVLREALASSCECATVHSLCRRKSTEPVDVLVVDEASMLSSEHGDLLVSTPSFAAAALLFVGDELQLPPVGSGELLRPLMEFAAVTPLSKNLRARSDELAAFVASLRGGDLEGVRQRCRQHATAEHMWTEIFDAGPSIVLTFRNEERVAYNSHAMRRHVLQEPRLESLDDYRCQKPRPRSFVPFVGLAVRFQDNSHRPGACRGSLGKIVVAEQRGKVWLVTVKTDGGEVKLEKGLFELPRSLRPAFATTTHDSQGSGFDDVHIVLPPSAKCPLLTLETLYTASSRARSKVSFHTHGSRLEDMMSVLQFRASSRCTPLASLLREAK